MPSNVSEVGHFRVIVLLKLGDPEGFFSVHFSLEVQANAQLIDSAQVTLVNGKFSVTKLSRF